MKTRSFITSLSAVIILLLVTAMPALALTNPTYVGFGEYSGNVIKVFRNLVETGDCLYTFHYKLEFASDNYSTETAADTIYFELYDDAGNLKAQWTPYVFPYFETNGYGDGVTAVYFGASDNASAWGSAAVFDIKGWPAYYTGFPSFSYTMAADDYVSVTTQEDNRAQLKELILLWCDRLGAIYQDTGVVLKTSSDYGEVLSSYGESYFGGAIEGLQAMCPELYFIQVYVPEVMDTSYNMTMADYFSTRADGSQWNKGFTAMGAGIGVSGTVMATIVFIVASIAICIWCIKKEWGIEAGGGISAFIGISAALIMGSVLFAIMMIVSLVAVIGLVWLLMLRRTG